MYLIKFQINGHNIYLIKTLRDVNKINPCI